jgi:lipopolysaccharide transport system ATP-binding protein
MSMNSDIAVALRNIDVYYYSHEKRHFTLKEWVLSGFKQIAFRRFHTLKDVNITIKKGEFVGFTGHNGAGKSTLLKVIAGVLKPYHGDISVHGRLSALIELGTGFVPDLTGRENLYFAGALLRFSRREMDKLIPSILEFAEIGDYIDEPFRTYSSGMQARLGFSLSITVKPEILLVDEVLAVGDEYFSRKCMEWVKEFRRTNGTLILVSHNLALLNDVCDRRIEISSGSVVFDGPTKKPVEARETHESRESALH